MCTQQSGKSFEEVVLDGQDTDDRKSITHYKDIEVGVIYIYIFFLNRGFFLHVSCPDSIAHYNDIDVDGFVVVVVVGSFCMYLDHIALHITKTLRCTLKKKSFFLHMS